MDQDNIFDQLFAVKIALDTYDAEKDVVNQLPAYWEYESFTIAVWNSVLNHYFPISEIFHGDEHFGNYSYMLSPEYHIAGTNGRVNSKTDIVISTVVNDSTEEYEDITMYPFLLVEGKRPGKQTNQTWTDAEEQLLNGLRNISRKINVADRHFWGIVVQGRYCMFYRGCMKADKSLEAGKVALKDSANKALSHLDLKDEEHKQLAADGLKQIKSNAQDEMLKFHFGYVGH